MYICIYIMYTCMPLCLYTMYVCMQIQRRKKSVLFSGVVQLVFVGPQVALLNSSVCPEAPHRGQHLPRERVGLLHLCHHFQHQLGINLEKSKQMSDFNSVSMFDSHLLKGMHIQRDKVRDTQTDRQSRQRDKQRGRQAYRQTYTQTDR